MPDNYDSASSRVMMVEFFAVFSPRSGSRSEIGECAARKRSVNVDPRPGALFTVSVPPIALARRRLMANG